MTINEIRSKYLKFFEQKGHTIIPSASLVPQNDPTTLFTGSGMQPMIPYLLGERHPLGTRITDSQKSFREVDIDEVGDNRHTTFFEMLGNWSLGDYFKREQIPWMFEFLTQELGIDPQNLYVTVFAGEPSIGVPQDDESIDIWKEMFASVGIDAEFVSIGSEADGYRLGMRGGRIFAYDVSKNWWSRAGKPANMPVGEPGGPDSEMFYDFGTPHDPKYGAQCHPNCDCGRFMEIGNNVFMEFIKRESGFEKLAQRNVDFGGGLERLAAAAQGNPDVFVAVDALSEIVTLLEHFSGKEYNDSRYQKSFRVIADHMRAATMMLGDGVRPSNTERGYVLRRLIRRAAQHAQKLGIPQDQNEESMLNRCAILIIEKYKQAYPELASEEAYELITSEIWKEEKQFGKALEVGMREFEKIAATGHIEASEAFTLFTTYGFPFEMTLELARERNIDVDTDGFEREMKKHRDLSRAGSEQKFKGGLADTSEKTTRLHTAHHLLLKALQTVLGPEVHQRGSNITQERLRIDFSYGSKLTKEQIAEVEKIVNEKIKEELPVTRSTLPKEEAEKLGAEHEFGAKYPDMVSVYSIGPKEATSEDPEFSSAFSIEFCGGPHVQNTKELAGVFKIQKEEAVASGIRRIKAVLL
ncbi:MAG: alanine--tRNA ligase-related protein [Candidatus Pacebacteria bacterium]|nr:alanine--tRNA ligase-related protein [Candidatus Paceibacterota bacterium]